MRTIVLMGLILASILGSPLVADEIVFENSRLRAVLDARAVWTSLTDKETSTEYCAADQEVTFASVWIQEKRHEANQATLTGKRLTIGFEGCNSRLHYEVTTTDDWIAFQLAKVAGTRPSRATIARMGVTLTEHGGSRLNATWNNRYAVCLRTINLQSHGVCNRQSDHSVLSMISQDTPGPRLEGAGAALIAAPTPDLKSILNRLAVAYDGLVQNDRDGIASRDLPMARQSYWFLNFTEDDVDQVISYCRKTGLRQVMIGSSSWCASVGHFTFKKKNYPGGIESLRRTVAKLHDHGILAGMHTFASKISKHDAHVTPVPDQGFWVDRSASLASAISVGDKSIRTESDLSQWPGSPVCKRKVWEGHVSKHQEVVIDDEIIRYESIGPKGEWNTFLGCERGAWGTRATEHEAGTRCRHYGVDGCINGYIIDQESPLFEETTSRLAHIFNYCNFDMVYFDGSEDVDRRRYHYYASNAHAVPLRKFEKRPLIHMGGGRTHGLWHSFTRYGTIDQYPGTYLARLRAGGTIDDWPSCKDHIDRTVRRVMKCEDEMTPGELGWFGIGPKKGDYEGLQFDEIEYLMCKSLAYNAPISLQTSFRRMEAHPLTPDILDIVRQYEELRLSHTVPSETLERLKEQDRDFVMLPDRLLDQNCSARFVRVERAKEVAGTEDVRAFLGSWQDGIIATLWHYAGKPGTLLLDTDQATVYDVRGRPVQVDGSHANTKIPVGRHRLLVHFSNLSPGATRKLFNQATLEMRPPTIIWRQAEDFESRVGNMAKGAAAEIDDSEALGGLVLCAGQFDRSGQTPHYCKYQVRIPHGGRWWLWARVRYPTGGDMSFGLVLPGDQITLSGKQVLGNCGVNNKKWHWTGRGGGITTVPPGSSICFRLERGPFEFHIFPREGPRTAARNPRLDCFCLTDDPDYRPSDDDAKAAFGSER